MAAHTHTEVHTHTQALTQSQLHTQVTFVAVVATAKMNPCDCAHISRFWTTQFKWPDLTLHATRCVCMRGVYVCVRVWVCPGFLSDKSCKYFS